MKLNLGCGKKLYAGWVNVDIYPPADMSFNLTEPFPLEHSSVDRIMCIHTLEHIPLGAGVQNFFQECLRVLKPGAAIEIEVPDFDRVMWYMQNRLTPETSASWFQHPLYGEITSDDPQVAYWQMHKTIYRQDSLRSLMEEHGFRMVQWEPARFHVPDRDLRMVGVK